MGAGMILGLPSLTVAKMSDPSSICLHSKEFNFLQGGLLGKEINKEMFQFSENRHE